MSNQKSEWIWMNGDWVRWENATIHIASHALHYGSSVFEGIRAYGTTAGPAIFRLNDHLQRLANSARTMQMNLGDHTTESLEQVCIDLVSRNGHDACYIRPIAWRGAGGLGVDGRDCPVEVGIFTLEWDRFLGSEAIEKGVDVGVSSWRRFPSGTMAPMGKIGGQYVNNQLVAMEAKRLGFAEGLMLDAAGNVCEGSGENIFVVMEGELWTPPTASSILAGITRDAILTLARELEIPIRFENIPRDMLYFCEEIFLTGTAAEITPVRSVDGIPVGEGCRGPVTRDLQQEFFSIVAARVPDRHGWLSLVPPVAMTAVRG